MSEESTTRVAKAQAYIQKLLGAVPNLSYHAKTMGSNGVTIAKIRDGKQDRISEKVFKQIEDYHNGFDFANPPTDVRGGKAPKVQKAVKTTSDTPIVSDETIRAINADIERLKAKLRILEDFKKSLGF